MPLGRYLAVAGSLLLALLFFSDWYLPKPVAATPHRDAQVSGIRITSIAKLPERIVIDTTLPTIEPPPTPVTAADAPVARSPRDSFALLEPPAPAAAASVAAAKPVHKKRKVAKRQHPGQVNQVASYFGAPPRQTWPAAW